MVCAAESVIVICLECLRFKLRLYQLEVWLIVRLRQGYDTPALNPDIVFVGYTSTRRISQIFVLKGMVIHMSFGKVLLRTLYIVVRFSSFTTR